MRSVSIDGARAITAERVDQAMGRVVSGKQKRVPVGRNSLECDSSQCEAESKEGRLTKH